MARRRDAGRRRPAGGYLARHDGGRRARWARSPRGWPRIPIAAAATIRLTPSPRSGRWPSDVIGGQSPQDVYAPLRAAAANGGCVALLGVGLTAMTLIHLAEQVAGRELFVRWALLADGRRIPARVGSCSRGSRAGGGAGPGRGRIGGRRQPLARLRRRARRWICGRGRDLPAARCDQLRRPVVRAVPGRRGRRPGRQRERLGLAPDTPSATRRRRPGRPGMAAGPGSREHSAAMSAHRERPAGNKLRRAAA